MKLLFAYSHYGRIVPLGPELPVVKLSGASVLYFPFPYVSETHPAPLNSLPHKGNHHNSTSVRSVKNENNVRIPFNSSQAAATQQDASAQSPAHYRTLVYFSATCRMRRHI